MKQVQLSHHEDICVAEVRGDVCFSTAAEIYTDGVRAIEAYDSLVVSFAHMGDFDATVVALCVSWLRRARQVGHAVSFRGFPKEVLAIADIGGVLDALKKALI